METRENKFIAYLHQHRLKLTTERRHILKAALSLPGHFDIDGLYDELRRRKNRISRATIYRAVPLLIESGIIKEALRSQSRPFYEHSYGHEHHDHMVCLNCGNVIEFKDDRIERLQSEVCVRYGFAAVEHMLGIRGYCKKCRTKNRGKGRRT